jgi:WD40 repeat protein
MGHVDAYDTMTGVSRATFDMEVYPTCSTFSPEDDLLAVGFWDGAINVWAIQTGNPV